MGEEFPPLCGLCAPQGIRPSPPPPPRFPVGTGTLRVLSFNILFSTDGQWNWANRGDNILEMIDLLDPDLIGLQENDARNGGASHGFYPSSRLVQDRPVYAAVSGGGDMVNTILYKADRFRVRDSGRTTLSDVSSPGATWVGRALSRRPDWAASLPLQHSLEPLRRRRPTAGWGTASA